LLKHISKNHYPLSNLKYKTKPSIYIQRTSDSFGIIKLLPQNNFICAQNQIMLQIIHTISQNINTKDQSLGNMFKNGKHNPKLVVTEKHIVTVYKFAITQNKYSNHSLQ